MSKLYGFSIVDFIKFQPEPHTVAISFASDIDNQYDTKLYAKLPQVYAKYDDVLVLKADDIPKPIDDCQIFTKQDAQNVIDFVKNNANKNIVVHCNAGVSRTGSIIHYIQQEYQNYDLVGEQQFSFNPLISWYLDVNQDNIQRLFNENKDVMDYLKNH